uniref:Uncharacterized protein n=1 Tax=Panagrolaimus sp. JU765 TaxID=591449 RepID=A0AC34RFS7_9BILA
MCPPIPNKIISKAAFHPPKRGKYYFLIGGTKNDRKVIFYAEQAIKYENISICFRTFVQRESIEVNVAGGFCRINTCILKTRLNDYIVMIHIKSHPSVISGHKSPKIMLISQPNSSDIGACMISDPSLVEIADSLCCDGKSNWGDDTEFLAC